MIPDRSSSQTLAAVSAGMWKLPRSVKIQVILYTVKAANRRTGMLPRSVKIQAPFHTVKAASAGM